MAEAPQANGRSSASNRSPSTPSGKGTWEGQEGQAAIMEWKTAIVQQF